MSVSTCRKLIFLLLCVPIILTACATTSTTEPSNIEIKPTMLSTEEKLLLGVPLDIRELAFSYNANCQAIKLSYERYVKGDLIDSGETVVQLNNHSGTLYILPKPEGNVLFFIHETAPETHNNHSVTTTRNILTIKVDNKGMASDFHPTLIDKTTIATLSKPIVLAAIATDNERTTQVYEPGAYEDTEKRMRHDELVLLSCLFE